MASISFPAKNMLAAPFNIKVTTTTLASSSSSSSSSLLFVFPFSNLNNKRSSSCTKLRMSSSTSSSSSSISTTNTVSDDQLPQSDTNTSWLEFSSNVSGEWDGHGADFTNLGVPVELPEMVVPDAYREWEVRVFDWQTQCPTLAQSQSQSHHLGLFYKLIKLLPTVGCEADAATRYTVHQMNVGGPDSQVSAFAYHSSGSYVALWPSSSSSTDTFQLEHCLVDPRNKESRARVIQAVAANKDSSRLVLTNIQVFREQWYGPFRNGDQLGGCAIRDSAFAITQPLDPSQLAGPWQSNNAIARFQNPPCTDLIQQLVDDSSKQSFTREDDHGDIVFLPKQLWCSVKQTEDGETHCEVGWLFEQGQAITSRCVFSTETNKLKEVKVGLESAVLEDL